MIRVFLSPSSQVYNLVHGGGNEQQYARLRCARAAQVLTAHGVTVRVSPVMNDDSYGYARSVDIGNEWGADLYVADHSNATGNPKVVVSGVHNYCWMEDPYSVGLGRAIGDRMDNIIGGTYEIRDGSHLYEVNGPIGTAVLLENGFHDNPKDAAIIRSKTNIMGEAIAYGILDHLGVKHNGRLPGTNKPSTSDGNVSNKDETNTIEELNEMNNSGFFWLENKVWHYMVCNTTSGFVHEFNNGTAGKFDKTYINPIAATFRTGSFSQITASQARRLRQDLLDTRSKRVELNGSIEVGEVPVAV